MVCYDLNDVFTAEFAESAEKNHILIMPLRVLPLRALRSRATCRVVARRAKPEAGGEPVSKQY